MTDGTKRVQYQMNELLQLFRYKQLGYPVCTALPHAVSFFTEEVRQSEIFFSVLALLGQAELLRTHEVSKIKPVIELMKSA